MQIDFALDSVNDPLGYLLIADGAQPPIIVPFYVSHVYLSIGDVATNPKRKGSKDILG